MLDTLPVTSGADKAAAMDTDHVLELNAAGATANVIAWDDWWQLKEQTNQELFAAIGDRNLSRIRSLLEENTAAQSMLADVNGRDERN